jgi:CrcB protein
MGQLVAIAAGGACGALLRFWLSSSVYAWVGRDFPYGTLAVNVLGSLAMGLLFTLFVERLAWDPWLRNGLTVGVLGAFTTFSTFSMETLNLLEQAEYARALANVLLSVLAALAACWLGVLLARQL